MPEKKATRRDCHHDRAKVDLKEPTQSITQEYERGTLIGGLMIAVSFGAMFLHAAVML